MHELELRQKISIMLAIMAAMLFAALNQTIVVTALPRILTDLGGIEYFSWVFTVYMLASTVPAIIIGKLSDIYGRKPVFLIGLAVFMLGSILSGMSQDIVQLIIYRCIQGTGAGAIIAASFTAVGDLFAPRDRGKWQGMLGAMFGIASVVGPALGGYIVDTMHWKWVFWAFIPIGVVAFFMIWIMFPRVDKRPDQGIDYLGSVLLVTMIVPMLLGFSWAGQKYAWFSPPILLLFGTTAISTVIFIMVEKRVAHPALPLELFRIRDFTISNLIMFIIGISMFGSIMYMPFLLQGVLGTTATMSGYLMIPMTLSLVTGSIIAGNLMSRSGRYKTLAIVGMTMLTVGVYLLSTITGKTPLTLIILEMALAGTGIGIGMPVFTLTVQNSVEHGMLGVATASVQLFRQLGGTIGVAIMGTVLSISMGSSVTAALENPDHRSEQFIAKFPADVQKTMESPQFLLNPDKLQHFMDNIPVALQAEMNSWIEVMRKALRDGLSNVFLTGAIMMLIAIWLSLLIRETPLRSTIDPVRPDDADNIPGHN